MAAWLRIPEVADTIRGSETHVRRLIASGQLEARHVGQRRVIVRAASVKDLLAHGYEPPRESPEAA